MVVFNAMEILSDNERAAFSERLVATLKRAGVDTSNVTQVAREFNRRYHGKAVSMYGVRKWLMGDAIPSQNKLRALADWLGVSSEWLRFGEGGSEAHQPAAPLYGDLCDRELCGEFSCLNRGHQEVVRKMVKMLLKMEKKEEVA